MRCSKSVFKGYQASKCSPKLLGQRALSDSLGAQEEGDRQAPRKLRTQSWRRSRRLCSLAGVIYMG
eukprot:scaffold60372_cov21-Tisochrysis_lutea.AAC.1